MPNKDFTQVAFDVFRQASGEVPNPAPDTAAKKASRKGGLKGGTARSIKLTPTRKREIAVKADQARWKKESPTEA